MLRSALSIVVAFAIALTSAEMPLQAQYSGAAADPQTRSSYPQVSQAAQDSPQEAQDPAQNDNAGVPTTPAQDAAADMKHAVARISVTQGDVNVKRGDTGELTTAVLNAPLLGQDRLQTADGSRAEIELDSANLVRLAPNTDVGMADLEYHRYQIQVGAGTIIYRVLRNSNAQAEVDTPNTAFRPLGEGEYRISVLNDGTTQITARQGEGEIFGPRGSERVTHGQTLLVRGSSNDPEFRTSFEAAKDQFDDWSEHRDHDLLASQSYRYVNRDISGAEDLDQYGKWVPSQYGEVWTPQNMPADWSPYSDGEWTWQDYYGWSWVDYSPWGWAPYHYGRWFYNGGYGWSWWPGAYGGGPLFWSPAMVGFFGWGGEFGFGIGFGFGFGSLGWCSLAPFEAFHRWWGPGWYGRGWGYGGRFGGGYGYGGGRFGSYARNVNVYNTYRNAAYRGGAITAQGGAFGGPHQHFTPATHTQLASANMFRGGRMGVTPTRASYNLSNRAAAQNPRLASAGSQHFYQSASWHNASAQSTARNGAAGQARSFAGANNEGLHSQTAMNRGTANGGWSRLGATAQNRTENNTANRAGAVQSQHGVAPNAQSSYAGRNGATARTGAAAATRGNSASGWQRFGDPSNGGSLRQGFTGNGNRAESSGWHSFGQPSAGNRSSGATGGSYSSGHYSGPASSPRSSYGGGYGSYSGARSGYSSPAYRSGASAYGSRGYGSSGYSAPHYSSPSYGGSSRSYSSPHYSAPSGGSHSGGSFGGGRSGGSFGGGGHSGGGGGHGGGSHR